MELGKDDGKEEEEKEEVEEKVANELMNLHREAYLKELVGMVVVLVKTEDEE